MSHLILIDRESDAVAAICAAQPDEDPLHTMVRHVRDRFDDLHAQGWTLRLPGTPGCHEIRLISAADARAVMGRGRPVMSPGVPGLHVATVAIDRLPCAQSPGRAPASVRPADPLRTVPADTGRRASGSWSIARHDDDPRTMPPVYGDDQIMIDLWQRLGPDLGRNVNVGETRSLRVPGHGRRRIVGHFIRYALHDENVYEFDRLLFDATAAVLSLSLSEIHALDRDRSIRMRLAASDPDLVPLNSPLAWSEDIDVVPNVTAFFGVAALHQITAADLGTSRAAYGVSAPMPPPVRPSRRSGLDPRIEQPF